jgi:hypothetical protein
LPLSPPLTLRIQQGVLQARSLATLCPAHIASHNKDQVEPKIEFGLCHRHVGRGLLPAHPLLIDLDGCGQLFGLFDLPGRFLANVRVGLERCHYDVVHFAWFRSRRGIKRI